MALLEAIGMIAAVVFLLYWYITRKHNYFEKLGIPYEKPVPIFGNLFDTVTTARNPGQVHEAIYRKYKGSKVVGMFNFMRPALLIRDPALVSQILTTDFQNFANNDFEIDEKLDPVLSKNIFIQRGEKWKRSRQALSPAFTVGKIKSTYEKIQTVSDKLIKYLENNPEQEVKSMMSLYTSEIVAAWGIGIDGHSFDTPDPILPRLGKLIFGPSLMSALSFAIITFQPWLAKVLRLRFVPQDVPDFFEGVLRDLIQQRANSSFQHKDFLQYFMELKKKREINKNEDQDEVTDDDIIAGVVSFFIEGYETSSLILSLLLYHLVKNPSIQTELRQEVDRLFEESKGHSPSFEAVTELALLNRIYSETVRMHGALSMGKVCTKTCTLDLGDGKQLKVEEGMSIVFSVLGLHNDPEYWPNPEKFDPSRFSDDAPPHVKGAYIPFGDGPRICIGMRIAGAMIKTAVVNIIRNFELLPTKKTAPQYIQDPKHFISSLLGGVHLKFHKKSF